MSQRRNPAMKPGRPMAAPPTTPRYSEFRLRSYYEEEEEHHMMIMPENNGIFDEDKTKKFSFQDFAQPVRLHRVSKFSEELPTTKSPSSVANSRVSPDSVAKMLLMEEVVGGLNKKKKRTEILKEWLTGSQKEERMREEQPWLLEDSDGRAYMGKLEGGLSQLNNDNDSMSKYVLFVNQGNEFRVIPVQKWYRFAPKITYPTLPLDEAEAKMSGKQKIFADDRWMMQARNRVVSSRMNLQHKLKGDEWEQVQLRSGTSKKDDVNDDEKMDIDYEDMFDDDDEGGFEEDLFEEKQSREEKASASSTHMPNPLAGLSPFELESGFDYTRLGEDGDAWHGGLSKTGKQLKKTLRQHDAVYASDNDEEEEDEEETTASKESQMSLDLFMSQPKTETKTIQNNIPSKKSISKTGLESTFPKLNIRLPLPSATPLTHVVEEIQSNGPHIKKIKIHPPTANIQKTDASFVSPQIPLMSSPVVASPTIITDSALLTEYDIIQELSKRPLPTKELISIMKLKLKAHPQNKDLFRTFLKKLVVVKPGQEDQENKLLELKKEFKPK